MSVKTKSVESVTKPSLYSVMETAKKQKDLAQRHKPDEQETASKDESNNGKPAPTPKITKRKRVNDRPLVRTTGELLLHTQLAHQLFFGRKGSKAKGIWPMTGLTMFSGNMRMIWDAAAQDDPYADFRLIQIEEAVNVAQGIVQKNREALKELLSTLGDRIRLNDGKSDKPVIVPLNFSVPHGFIAARLLADYDELVISGLHCRHVGLIVDDDWRQLINKSAAKIRHLFSLSDDFKYSGATRDDFAANNPRARDAATKYGELPQDVLEGSRRAKVAPSIKVKPSESMATQKEAE